MTIRMLLEHDLLIEERDNTREEGRMGAERGKWSECEDSRKDKSTMKVAWKNVRKIRTREKQMELDGCMIGCRRMNVMYVL